MSQIIYGQLLKYTDDIAYLGFTFSSDQKDDKDLLRQLRMLYIKQLISFLLIHKNIYQS